MKPIFFLENSSTEDVHLSGGKAAWLKKLHDNGFLLPKTLILSTAAYGEFIETRGLREKIALELNRKEFKDMRWEEIWDASLRIRNLFLKEPFPVQLYNELDNIIETSFAESALAVRSSSPEEDQAHSSFAGLHDSFLGIHDTKQLVHSIKKVWSSLWSDRALLYRQELSLSVEQSSMAVIIQELIEGDVSGICFTRDPIDEKRLTIEAVYGLNQGLVDGDISPDRWSLDRATHQLEAHVRPDKREKHAIPDNYGVTLAPLPPSQQNTPPLGQNNVKDIARQMMHLEELHSMPLDVEWTLAGEKLYILQSRPITTLQNSAASKDERSWYISLHRSLENLKLLRSTIEDEMLPQMQREAEEMSACQLNTLANEDLAAEIRHRQQRSSHWSEIYWRDCIPFAHGIRLFGDIYNDLMIPKDPHEFVQLLKGEDMLSLKRNAMIMELAEKIRQQPDLVETIQQKGLKFVADDSFRHTFDDLLRQYGSYFSSHSEPLQTSENLLLKIVVEYSKKPGDHLPLFIEKGGELEDIFLKKLRQSSYSMDADELIDLARASYRIRDDDNIYLGRVEEQATLAVTEGKRRLKDQDVVLQQNITPEDIANILCGTPLEQRTPQEDTQPSQSPLTIKHRARQLIGQPASQGLAQGKARVIKANSEIADFKADDILVVDSIDPTMTFFAPLATAIIEQRGGMLIHGAIIAREYGIPCVTGITSATQLIKTGDTLTVDGYLGIVIIDRQFSPDSTPPD